MNENDITDSCNYFQISRKFRVSYYYKYQENFRLFSFWYLHAINETIWFLPIITKTNSHLKKQCIDFDNEIIKSYKEWIDFDNEILFLSEFQLFFDIHSQRITNKRNTFDSGSPHPH